MENATKALLIAAAILIAIVLVSIGVFVLRQGQDAIDSVDMSEAQILSFNSQFESYTGTQRGSQVNALLQRIVSSNVKSKDSTPVTVEGDVTLSKDATSIPTGVNTAAFYKVEVSERDTSTQLIKKIKITKINN